MIALMAVWLFKQIAIFVFAWPSTNVGLPYLVMVISAVTFILRQLMSEELNIYFLKYICTPQMYILRQKPHRVYKLFQ